jgi:DNA repair protein RecN (Recombination protein N)
MLAELRVKELGVIADLSLVLGPGLIALTGETGAGKTLVVEAIELLLGGRADPVLVRPGAPEAVIEGRFVVGSAEAKGAEDDGDGDGNGELVVSRTVPVSGRSRAYLNGRMAPLSALGENAGALVDLHGQHSHQSLLAPAAQRSALDRYAQVDLEPIAEARRRMRQASASLAQLGGDAGSRAREQDMLAFQVREIDAAAVTSADEDEELAAEEERLAHARSHREAAEQATALLSGDAGVTDALGSVIAVVAGHPPLSGVEERLRAAAIDLADVADDLRSVAESLEDDPQRLAGIRERRQLLHQLRRKYGESLSDVTAYAESARERLAELDAYEQRAARLEEARDQAAVDVAVAEDEVGRQRRQAAPLLATAIEHQLHGLAMPKARLEVHVGEDRAGDDVTWLLAANPGEAPRTLAKVASGGELARTMLAVRLVLGPAGRPAQGGPTTLVFDEVDAGIGGEAALAVGRALAELGRHHQVLVVTHLAQVAAFADHQIAVQKGERDGRAVATVHQLDEAGRVVELSRMLSGQPDSATARLHAEELLLLAHSSGRR